MASNSALDREEYIEQVYFFRTFRERLTQNLAAQEILERLHEEILATTRLPLAIQFLATELKHTGELASGFARLPHYFTPYQTFVVGQAEREGHAFSLPAALLVLERERSIGRVRSTPAGMFVYQFESLSRNRLGFADGLTPCGRPALRRRLASVSRPGAQARRRLRFRRHVVRPVRIVRGGAAAADADYVPPVPPLFGEKGGQIARANRGRDPLFLFAALQRQLGYPEVPRPRPRDDLEAQIEAVAVKLREMEARLRLVEGEVRGQVDLSEFGKPELLKDNDEPGQAEAGLRGTPAGSRTGPA